MLATLSKNPVFAANPACLADFVRALEQPGAQSVPTPMSATTAPPCAPAPAASEAAMTPAPAASEAAMTPAPAASEAASDAAMTPAPAPLIKRETNESVDNSEPGLEARKAFWSKFKRLRPAEPLPSNYVPTEPSPSPREEALDERSCEPAPAEPSPSSPAEPADNQPPPDLMSLPTLQFGETDDDDDHGKVEPLCLAQPVVPDYYSPDTQPTVPMPDSQPVPPGHILWADACEPEVPVPSPKPEEPVLGRLEEPETPVPKEPLVPTVVVPDSDLPVTELFPDNQLEDPWSPKAPETQPDSQPDSQPGTSQPGEPEPGTSHPAEAANGSSQQPHTDAVAEALKRVNTCDLENGSTPAPPGTLVAAANPGVSTVVLLDVGGTLQPVTVPLSPRQCTLAGLNLANKVVGDEAVAPPPQPPQPPQPEQVSDDDKADGAPSPRKMLKNLYMRFSRSQKRYPMANNQWEW